MQEVRKKFGDCGRDVPELLCRTAPVRRCGWGVVWLPTVWARTVSQLVGFKAVDHHVLLRKELVELDLVLLFDEREALSEQTVKSEVGSLLCAALDEHRAKLCLLPRSDLQLGQLVRALVHLQSTRNGFGAGPPRRAASGWRGAPQRST